LNSSYASPANGTETETSSFFEAKSPTALSSLVNGSGLGDIFDVLHAAVSSLFTTAFPNERQFGYVALFPFHR
jgi:hypothetical protein